MKLRYILTNYRISDNSSASGGGDLNDTGNTSGSDNISSMKSSFSVTSSTHRFLQDQTHYFRMRIPFSIRDLVEKIYISLCRLPILDRFIRIPDCLWRMSSFKVEYTQFLKNDTSTLPPLDYLRDPLILKEHLKHILSVGWTSRTQFEYEYVNMLTLLHNLSEDYYLPMSTNRQSKSSNLGSANSAMFEEHPSMFGSDSASARTSSGGVISSLPSEEIKERNKCICLVIKGLSSWLIKSTLTPKSGNSLNSLYEHISRCKPPSFLQSRLGKQFSRIKRIIESFNRYNQFTRLNSITIANNSNLLFMLDPTLIDEFDRSMKKALSASNSSNTLSNLGGTSSGVAALDFTQPQPTADALANLFQVSMTLSERDYNIMFSTNIERNMISNLPTNTDTYFSFTQISLEGLLKFLGQWNKSKDKKIKNNKLPQLV